MSSEIYFLLKK